MASVMILSRNMLKRVGESRHLCRIPTVVQNQSLMLLFDLDLCDKRKELRKKRFEPEGSEKYKEVNNNIKRCMKKAKENWIGEQCSETEENLSKNSSKRAYQLVKDLTTVKQGTATTVQDRSGKCLTEQ